MFLHCNNKAPNSQLRGPDLNLSERIFPIVLLHQVTSLKVQVYISEYLPTVLAEVCISGVVYWCGLQVLHQDETKF